MKNVILSLFTISILCISCQKDDTPAPPVQTVQYMSLAAGSSWHYELVDNTLTDTTAFTVTSTSKDSVINGKTYHVFTNSNGTANEYYNITGNDYFNFMSLPAALGGSTVDYLYLKDNAAVGASWSQSYPLNIPGFTLNATLTNTITEKGISKTIKGNTFNDVIHITTTIAVTVSGIPLPAGALTTDIQSFYAPKTGMIQSINKININFGTLTNNTDEQTNLTSSDIK